MWWEKNESLLPRLVCVFMRRIAPVLLFLRLVWFCGFNALKEKKKTVITFMRVKCGIMALAAVVVSLIEGILAAR